MCILVSSQGEEVQQFYCCSQLIRKFRPIANIPDPYEGDILETRYTPLPTATFFVHNEPLTYADTALIKLIEKQRQYRQSPEHDIRGEDKKL